MIFMHPDNYITVAELKKYLEGFEDDTMFVMSSDAEGNTYSPLAGMDTVTYVPDSTWSGYLWSDYAEDDDYEDSDFAEDAGIAEPPENAVNAIVLWPVN